MASFTLNKCPLCDSLKLPLVDKVATPSAEVRILQCQECLAILNEGAYQALDALGNDIRKNQETTHYDPKPLEDFAFNSEISANRLLLDTLLELGDYRGARGVFLDFGAGRGCTAVAAKKLFERVYALDFNVAMLEQTFQRAHTPKGSVVACDSLQNLPEKIDCIFAWHVIEHLVDPVAILRDLRSRINENGMLFAQVPKFRQNYVIDCHFVFFNYFSFECALNLSGFSLRKVLDDHENGFLTVVATPRKFDLVNDG